MRSEARQENWDSQAVQVLLVLSTYPGYHQRLVTDKRTITRRIGPLILDRTIGTEGSNPRAPAPSPP